MLKYSVDTRSSDLADWKVPMPLPHSIMQVDFSDLEEGDYVVHLQHGIGRFQSQTTAAMASKPGRNWNKGPNTWSLNMPPKAGLRALQALCPRQ